ncbi:MAG: hypothetical protein ACM3NV_09465 [Syntrophothermus sp.]
MLARVVRWEGAEAASLESSAAGIRAQAEAGSGPPPGVPAKAFLLLQDPPNGKAMAITLFESEDDYREGDATLESMSPPGEGMGERIGVEKYEVALNLEV